MNRLSARSVATLGAGKYNDGAGLLLQKKVLATSFVKHVMRRVLKNQHTDCEN